MRRFRLTRSEKNIENALVKGEYFDIGEAEFKDIAQAIASRRKNAVLNIRVNSRDLISIKHKAEKLGVGYQTFLSELIHRLAHAPFPHKG